MIKKKEAKEDPAIIDKYQDLKKEHAVITGQFYDLVEERKHRE